MVIVTSAALPMSAVKFGGWLPPGGLLMFSPSTVRRDSTPRPPWIGKIANTGPVLTLLLFVMHARHCVEQIAVAPDARKRSHGLVVERDLAPRALHVDDRRFASDGNGFLHAADAQLGVDRDDTGPAHDLTLTSHGREAREAERDRVRAGLKILDAIPAGAIGNRCADFLDQRWTCGFHSDTGEHGSRVVPDGASERGLCPHRRWSQTQ